MTSRYPLPAAKCRAVKPFCGGGLGREPGAGEGARGEARGNIRGLLYSLLGGGWSRWFRLMRLWAQEKKSLGWGHVWTRARYP
jgi:hypothetical protein